MHSLKSLSIFSLRYFKGLNHLLPKSIFTSILPFPNDITAIYNILSAPVGPCNTASSVCPSILPYPSWKSMTGTPILELLNIFQDFFFASLYPSTSLQQLWFLDAVSPQVSIALEYCIFQGKQPNDVVLCTCI